MFQIDQYCEIINKSHNRCIGYGVEKNMPCPLRILKNKEFDMLIRKNRQLIKITRPFMEILYDILKESGFSLCLADKNGVILTIIGDEDIIQDEMEMGVVEGSDMSEKSAGTNGIGTAIHENSSLQILGEEHFINIFHSWTCSSAVIHSEEGYIIGCLNLTGRGQVAHVHTLGLVVSAVKSIENHLKVMQNIYNFHNNIGGRAKYTFNDIIGRSEEILKLKEQSNNIANSPSTVLIQGESGTGKELIAQSIHNNSERRNNSFIAINCGAIPKSLIESELFGYEEGAFTGAKRGGSPGKFEIANGGTIFLDEIGEMPLDMQVNLLRVLQEGYITRIGGNRCINVNIRIIASTNKNLKSEVDKGNFRADLYYRLSVIPIHIPPLRERLGDVETLIKHFLKIKAIKLGKPIPKIRENIYENLLNYNWPGNVRELENCIENIVNMDGNTSFSFENKDLVRDQNNSSSIRLEYGMCSLEELEKRAIRLCMDNCGGNITKSCRILGINRSTLYAKIKKYHII